jgi:hypothetical protein
MAKRLMTCCALVGATVIGVSLLPIESAGASPNYSASFSYAAPLARSPYVTDLEQTSAEVNWAETGPNASPGYLEWGPTGNCTANTKQSTSKLPAFQPDVDSANAETDQIGTAIGDYQDSVPLSGLSGGAAYCYEVFSATGVNLLGSGVSQTFSTLDATTSAAPLSFDVVGDLGETAGVDESVNGVNEDQAAIDDEIGQSGAKFVLLAGDVAYSGGTDANYGDLTSTGSEVSDIFGPAYWAQTGGIPVFSADGNHGQNITGLRTFPEEQTAKNSGGVYAYDSYSDPTENVSTSSPDAWYAFSDGGVRIYVLDAAWQDSSTYLSTTNATGSLCGAVGSAQAGYCQGYELDAAEHWQQTSGEYKWLKADLAAHPGGIKMAVFHYPLQSDNATQPSDPYLQQDLEPMLAAGGVQIAFNGHAHTYQRFTPNPGSGHIISYVTGGGGGTLEPVQGGSTCSAIEATEQVYALGYDSTGGSSCGQTAPAGSSLVAADVYNFLHVTVANGAVTVSPENAQGQAFDSQTYQLATAPPPSTTTTSPVTPPSPPSSPGPVGAACALHLPAGTVVATAALPDGSGYYEVDSVGDVAAFGAAKCYGAMTGTPLSRPMVGMAVDPTTGGYWLVASDGGIFSFNAPFLGSTGAIHLNQPVVGMTASPDGRGYWFVASDGGIFSFGDATFFGSTGSMRLNRPVVGMASAPSGRGYWLVASDGGLFTFGTAGFFGSTGSMHLNQPVVGMEATGDGKGYRLIATDGGVFDFGSAPFYGSAGSIKLNRPMIGGANDNATGGYWLMASDGGVFTYNAPFLGSAA